MIKITVVDLMSNFRLQNSCIFMYFQALSKGGGANIFPKFTYKKVNY